MFNELKQHRICICPDTQRIYLTVSDCTMLPFSAFLCDDSPSASEAGADRRWRRQQFSLFFGKLETFLTDFAKSIFAGGAVMTRWQELLLGVRFCSASICKRTSLWSLSALCLIVSKPGLSSVDFCWQSKRKGQQFCADICFWSKVK